MSETETRSFKKLKNDFNQQTAVIEQLLGRLNTMRDDIELLKGDVVILRERVTEDIKYLYDREAR